jgi:hypothetical protein
MFLRQSYQVGRYLCPESMLLCRSAGRLRQSAGAGNSIERANNEFWKIRSLFLRISQTQELYPFLCKGFYAGAKCNPSRDPALRPI